MRLTLSVLFLVMLLFGSASADSEIAVLHSTPRATAWSDELARGLRASLGDAAGISQVFLGSPQDDDEHFETRFEQIQATWGATSPAVVVTDGPLAFAFMRKYREDLFVGAPLFYCGMLRPEPEFMAQCGNCSGLPLQWGVRETVDLLFRLRPDTRTVVGIIDGTQQGKTFRMEAEAAMASYMDRAQLIFPGHEPGDDAGLNVDTLKDVAASVPRSASVLFLRFGEDRKGLPVDSAEAFQAVTSRSDAPVFVLSEEFFAVFPGEAAGGVVVSPRAQGQAVGKAVLQALAGETISEMRPEPIVPLPLVDLTALGRFGVATAGLPSEVRAINAPHVHESSEGVSSTGVAAGVTAITILVIVFFLIRRRRSAE